MLQFLFYLILSCIAANAILLAVTPVVKEIIYNLIRDLNIFYLRKHLFVGKYHTSKWLYPIAVTLIAIIDSGIVIVVYSTVVTLLGILSDLQNTGY